MTDFDYSGVAATARKQIERFGKPALLQQLVVAQNPGAGTTTPTPTLHPVRVLAFPYKVQHVDGTRVRQGDLQALLAAESTPVEPKMGWGLYLSATEDEAKLFKIIAVEPLEPGPTPILYTLQVRR